MKFKENSFTFGFEIEGAFTNKLIDKLSREYYRGGDENTFSVKSDGSIRWSSIMTKYHLSDSDIDNLDITDDDNTEVNLGIFKNQKDLLKAIKMFKDGENYFQDQRCGLHLHIFPKEIEVREAFWSFKFLKKLQNFAYNDLCECVKARKSVDYCAPYKTFKQALRDYDVQEKYRFVRNHPSETLEFRFFAPCKHKAENVKKFLNYLMKELTLIENKKSITISLPDSQDKNHNSDYVIGNRDREYNLNFIV